MLKLLVVGAWACLVPYSVWFFLSAKKREREQAEVQERFSGLYNSSKDAMGFVSLDGMLLDVNDSFCKLTGYSREELLTRKKYQDITPKEYEEYEAKIIEEILRTGKPAEYEKECIRKDGSPVPILLTTFVVKGTDGKPIGFAAIMKDITKRKKMEDQIRESEERFKNLYESIQDPVGVFVGSEGRLIDHNKAFKKLSGYTDEELKDKTFLDFIHPDDLPVVLERYRTKYSEEDLPLVYEIRAVNKKGEIIPLEISVSTYKVKGRVIGIEVIHRDITERKRLRENLLKSEKLAAIGQLAAAVGHEIRNPLGVINNSTYFLNRKLKDTADEKVMKHLKIIERKINSANLIVSDLLDFARKKPPTLKETNLNDVVMSAFSNIISSENIKVTIKVGEIPPMLLDQEQIRRVFQNMILNAVQAMPKGGKLIIRTSKHDNSAKITFKDTGAGIPEENLPKLFTPLFSTKAKGVGLGLSICKQIVEGHGGNITVKSKVGKGSTFTVKLPIRVKEEVKNEE